MEQVRRTKNEYGSTSVSSIPRQVNSIASFKDCHDPPACPCDKSNVSKSIKHWWNGIPHAEHSKFEIRLKIMQSATLAESDVIYSTP